jgi:hypothetical protein
MGQYRRRLLAIAVFAVFACLVVTLAPIVTYSCHPNGPISNLVVLHKLLLTTCPPATPNWVAGALTGIAACFVIILSARALRKR